MDIPDFKRYSTLLGAHELIIETGKYAKQVSSSVTVRYGDNLLLVTVHMSEEPISNDFLPLSVDYEERHYAIGKIPGSFMRREGRPGTQAILNARIIDRQIRPLFPKGFRHEIQIIVTVLSADKINDPAPIAAIGTSAALAISEIPWEGPTACANIGYVDNQYIINPSYEVMEKSRLELTLAATKDAVLMVEASADELDEQNVIGAIESAHNEMQGVIQLIEQMKVEIGKEKVVFEPKELDSEFTQQIQQGALANGLHEALLVQGKHERKKASEDLHNILLEKHVPDTEIEGASEKIADLKEAFQKAEQLELRRMILEENLRCDRRQPKDIRPIWVETSTIPKTHGSAVFTRGETQVLSVTTLGVGRDNMLIDDLGIDKTEEFMLHYNFPPFSTGEVKRLRGVSRRELGHGNLAKRALERMIPSQETFPYVVRVVAETLESNGSSSMATVCSSSLSLMDAGVPVRKAVAGIAMGLVKEGDNYKVLSDILGTEDALGDMDFKVTGTQDGITALQMDIKIKGITAEIMLEALMQAREGRLHILGIMNQALDKSRPEISPYAPRILQLQISPEKIGAVIGPGGKQVRELETLGVRVEIADDGLVTIYSEDSQAAQTVSEKIKELTADLEIGVIYEGTVVKITDFGAFVNILPNIDGLLHISQIALERINSVHDYLQMGDKLKVKVKSIDERTGKPDLIRPELEGLKASRNFNYNKQSHNKPGYNKSNYNKPNHGKHNKSKNKR